MPIASNARARELPQTSGTTIEVGRHEPGRTGAGWDAFVTAQPGATVAQLYGWGEIIRRVYGHRFHPLAATTTAGIAGVLPLVEVRSRIFGSSLVSMPYLDTGGVLAAAPAPRRALLTASIELARSLGLHRLDLRSSTRPVLRAPLRGDKVTLILELGSDPEALWKTIGAKPRNQVRKAQKSGLSALRTGRDGLGDFYRVYAANMRDLGSPPHKLAWFETIFEVLGPAAGCHLVQRDGETVGGLIAIDLGATVTVPWASSDRRLFKLCPNNLLYWETFRAAIERGCTRFDFGRSSRGAGTYRFKRQWGACEVPLHWQAVDPRRTPALAEEAGEAAPAASGAAPADAGSAAGGGGGAPGGGRRALAARLWRCLPVATATWLGSRLRGGITL